jgi:uncharacterized protein (TIGR02448 family)
MFKKLGLIALLLTAMTTSAMATDGPCGDQDQMGTFLCGVLFVSLSPLGSTIGVTALTTNHEREVYINQVRDDAAEYVGSAGAATPSAVLKSAIETIRATTTDALGKTDLELAKFVIGSQN